MNIDAAVKKFAEIYKIKNVKMVEFIQYLMEGLTYQEITDKMGLSTMYFQKWISKLSLENNGNGRSGIMAEIYKLERDQKHV